MTQLYDSDMAPLETDGLADCDEGLPFELLPGALDKGLVLICDHASNHLPEQYGALGPAQG